MYLSILVAGILGYYHKKLQLSSKYEKSLFAIGSVLEHFVRLTYDAKDLSLCKRYMKPGVNPREAAEQFDLSCGCNGRWPCRDIDNNGCKPSASMDCKNAIQKVDYLWIKNPIAEIDPTDPYGRYCGDARYMSYYLASKCNIKQLGWFKC